MENVVDQIGQNVVDYMPHLAGALAILILGWLVARVVPSLSAVRWQSGCNRSSLASKKLAQQK
jgi:mechanosensitive ion channel-like protein